MPRTLQPTHLAAKDGHCQMDIKLLERQPEVVTVQDKVNAALLAAGAWWGGRAGLSEATLAANLQSGHINS